MMVMILKTMAMMFDDDGENDDLWGYWFEDDDDDHDDIDYDDGDYEDVDADNDDDDDDVDGMKIMTT